MKTSNALQPTPFPAPSRDEPRELSLAILMEGLADTLIEAGPVLRRLEDEATQHRQQQQQSQQRIESAAVRHHDQLVQVGQRLQSIEQSLGSMAREVARSAEPHPRLVQRLETMEYNLEQVRLLADAVVQKQQQLVDDFIERRVTDHLHRQFLDVQSALSRYSANGNPNLKADIQAVAEAIEDFLVESGLRVIHPEPGAAFEPREHRPIKVLPALEGQADGTIAETFTPGLSRGQRVIQQARVAVFKADGVKSTQ